MLFEPSYTVPLIVIECSTLLATAEIPDLSAYLVLSKFKLSILVLTTSILSFVSEIFDWSCCAVAVKLFCNFASSDSDLLSTSVIEFPKCCKLELISVNLVKTLESSYKLLFTSLPQPISPSSGM